jgi:hypothetical protein
MELWHVQGLQKQNKKKKKIPSALTAARANM